MADEFTITSYLTVNKPSINLLWSSQPKSFRATLNANAGPITFNTSVAVLGTDFDLSPLTKPGWAWMQNLDPTNLVQYGIYDPESNKFIPFGRILPGKHAEWQFAEEFRADYVGTGTGTSAYTNRFRVRAKTAPCRVLLVVFDD